MQPKQGNEATMVHEISSSFHYLNRGSWATHVQFASLAYRLESSHLDCAKPQPGVRTKDGPIFTAVGLELEEQRWGSGNRMITYWNLEDNLLKISG
jgi:hypothetical protein